MKVTNKRLLPDGELGGWEVRRALWLTDSAPVEGRKGLSPIAPELAPQRG